MPTATSPQNYSPIYTPTRRPSDPHRLAVGLSSEQIDIWEYAALLYHGYEWQAAADTFGLLAQAIDDPEEQALCFFNSGLIQARLGDYDVAAVTLTEASHIDQGLLVTIFLIALISYELGDLSKAEACIEICMDGLDGAEAFDYTELGMVFVLTNEVLLHNLREIRQQQFSAGFTPRTPGAVVCNLIGIPAECVFEAPARSIAAVATPSPASKEQRPRKSQRLRNLFQARQKDSISSLPFVRGASAVYSPASPLRQVTNASPDPSPASSHQSGLSTIPENHAIEAASSKFSPTAPTFSSSSPSANSSGSSRRGWSWHRRPSTPYTPREARGEYGSTKDLERFIRTGETKELKILLPKNATGDSESTAELAKFISRYAPGKASVADGIEETPPEDPPVINGLRMEHLLDRKCGVARALMTPESDTTSEQSSTGEIPSSWRQTSLHSQYSAVDLESVYETDEAEVPPVEEYELLFPVSPIEEDDLESQARLPAESVSAPPATLESSTTHPPPSMFFAAPPPIAASTPESSTTPPPPSIFFAPPPPPRIPEVRETTIELLQPSTFQSIRRKKPSEPIRTPQPPPPPLQPDFTFEDSPRGSPLPPQAPSSSASSDTTYERRTEARNDTLKALEGLAAPAPGPQRAPCKLRLTKASLNKALPPDPGGEHSKRSLRFAGSPDVVDPVGGPFGTPRAAGTKTPGSGDTVRTMNFFDRVLRPG